MRTVRLPHPLKCISDTVFLLGSRLFGTDVNLSESAGPRARTEVVTTSKRVGLRAGKKGVCGAVCTVWAALAAEKSKAGVVVVVAEEKQNT